MVIENNLCMPDHRFSNLKTEKLQTILLAFLSTVASTKHQLVELG